MSLCTSKKWVRYYFLTTVKRPIKPINTNLFDKYNNNYYHNAIANSNSFSNFVTYRGEDWTVGVMRLRWGIYWWRHTLDCRSLQLFLLGFSRQKTYFVLCVHILTSLKFFWIKFLTFTTIFYVCKFWWNIYSVLLFCKLRKLCTI